MPEYPASNAVACYAAPSRCIGIDDAGRIGSSPRPVVARDRPEVAGLGPAAAGIEYRCPRLVDGDLGRAEQDLLHAQINRLELRRRDTDPEGQRGTIDRQALQLHDLRLPIERTVPSEFVDHDTGHKSLGRNAVLDQTLRCRCLDDRALAGPAAIFGAMRHDHLVLGRNLVETLRALFPDDMHRAVAARANRALRLDRDMNVRKMRRQRTAVDASLLALIRRFVGGVVLLLLFLFASRLASAVSISSNASCI